MGNPTTWGGECAPIPVESATTRLPGVEGPPFRFGRAGHLQPSAFGIRHPANGHSRNLTISLPGAKPTFNVQLSMKKKDKDNTPYRAAAPRAKIFV